MMGKSAPCLLVTALTLLWGPTGVVFGCSRSMNSLGTTLPNGDIALLQGSTLQIDCLLYPMNLSQHGKNASDLHFYRNQVRLTPSDTTSLQILNETVLRLTVTNVQLFDGMYYCKTVIDNKPTAICLNSVFVGTVPQNITNFSCVSNNWQNLTCTWRPHRINYVRTEYSLSFTLKGRASRGTVYKCPQIKMENYTYVCYWDLSTDPPYRQPYSHYTFTLTGSNKFANNTQEIKFNHFARVRPAPPFNLHRVELTPNSALLNWTLHHGIQHFSIGLVHKIEFCSELDEGEFKWKEAYLSPANNNVTLVFNLTLPYANTFYDARVYIKTEEAKNNLWSDYSSITLKTLSKLPDRAPQTDIGSFESITELETRKVFICWQQIEKYEENGENFTYQIVNAKVGGKPKYLNASVVNKAYMVFDKLSLDKVEITIKSCNSVGHSEDQTHMIIPAQKEILPEPRAFTKIEFGNGTYELSWNRVIHEDLNSYTIFWCDNNRERPYQCEGQLNWERVPANATIKYITIPNNTNSLNSTKIYQFAISANSRKSSSGMVWALCAVIPNKSVSKIRNIWINRFGSTFIEVGWKLECSDRIGSILGYNITYCPVFSLYNKSCKEDPKSIVVVRDPSEIHSNVTDLKPHTTYAIQVAVITRYGNGHSSDPLYNITSEGAPTPPINVTISELCNDRMRVSWKPPLITNGYLKYYQVNYDTYDSLKTERVDIDEMYSEVVLKNLTGFTNYTITVNACTVSCSNNSVPVYVRTAIGLPGQINQPFLQNSNSSKSSKLIWDQPQVSGGANNYYQVRIIKLYKDYTNATQIFNTTVREFTMDFPNCNGIVSQSYDVRAINIDNVSNHGAVDFSQSDDVQFGNAISNTIQYKGPWSVPLYNSCASSAGNYYWLYGFIIVVFVVLLVYGLRRLWICCKTMQNIKPCLPPGLGSNIEKEPVKKPKWTMPSKHKEDKKQSRPFADAESLLDKGIITNMDMLNTTMCDNSNYSENSDSTVALSLTSSNRGTSDEAKDVHGGQDGAQSETLSANSSLRWRNNGSSGSRPASAASSDPAIWNSPITKPSDLIQDDMTQMTPYSTIGMPNEYLPAKPENNANIDAPQPKGYVSFGSFATDKLFSKPPVHQPFVSLQQPAYVSADLPINGDGRPARTDLPSGYVMNGTINPSSIVSSPVKSLNVESIEPIVNGVKLPLDNYDPNYAFNEESMFVQLPNDEVDISNKPVLLDSGYVKRNDPVIMNGIDTSCLQKMLGGNQQQSAITPKQTNLTNIVMPSESAMVADAALSPEAYCRFGPNTNVPQAFDFQNQSDEDADVGFLTSIRSADDFDYEKHSLFEEPRRSDPSVPPSHYVPLNLQNVNKL
ncbi:cytokine receptor domeless [Arctopsyche grandis]|uniref:cytokine receptor domeless n=1 Tax=Arctopsyche grandis TaxID=121162 RepID=UPI00406DA118